MEGVTVRKRLGKVNSTWSVKLAWDVSSFAEPTVRKELTELQDFYWYIN